MTEVQPATRPDERAAEAVRPGSPSTRRAVLAGAGALGATVVLAACGTDNGGGTVAPEPPAGSAGTDGGATAPLATTAEVPVGGGIIKGDFVITQPSEGEFKAFSKICTHQRCAVTRVDNGLINCKCHNSSFSIEDGSVKGGPASSPLPETKVRVDGDDIVAA